MAGKNFYELDAPVSDHHSHTIDWFVRIKDNEPSYYILNDGTACLGNLMHHPTIDFYFKTEIEAHEAAAKYYDFHSTIYPYHSEWLAAVSKLPSDGDDDESQTMVFT